MRLDYIDIAKGIGIILIIGLHSSFHMDWMVNFEMPLFFLLSGLFFKPSYNKVQFKIALIKKINVLLIPYLFFELPKFIYDVAFSITHNVSLIDSIVASSVPSTTWFLLALFEGWLLCQLFTLYLPKISLWIACILCAAIGYMMHGLNIVNILFVGSAFTLTPYLIIGFLLRSLLLKHYTKIQLLGGIIFCFVVCYTFGSLSGGEVFYRANQFNSVPLISALVCGISGSFGIVFISKLIGTNVLFEYYGRNSLIILGTHLYFITLINRTLPGIQNWIVFLLSLVLVVPTVFFLKRVTPRLCGAKPLFIVA